MKKIYYYSKNKNEIDKFEHILNFHHFHVSIFESLKELFDSTKQSRPSLIIIEDDYQFDEGVCLHELILKSKIFECTEKGLIVFTYYEYEEKTLEKLSENNVIYIKKPVMTDEIVQRFEELFT